MDGDPPRLRVEDVTSDSHPGQKQKVLIVGSGVAGLEAALALRALAGERVQVEMRDPRREFVYRPFAVGKPYGAAQIFRYGLDRLAERCGARFRTGGIVSVDPQRRFALGRDGERTHFDHLVVANGVRMLWSVPGAVTFCGVADEGRVGEVIADLRAGRLRDLVFTMPSGHSWVLPLYELALFGASELEKSRGVRARLTIVTPEDAPLEVFGRHQAEQMAGLLEERGVAVIAGAESVKVEGDRLWIAPGGEIAADAVIGLPRLEGRRIAGIPHDPDGFVSVDECGRVLDLDRVYAAGDVTSLPVKQGGVASHQADAVAEDLAAVVGGETIEPQPQDPVLFGLPSTSVSWPIGRYLGPLLDSLAAQAESTSPSAPVVRSTSHG
jgi:sulfide:quinone oxidoreductase